MRLPLSRIAGIAENAARRIKADRRMQAAGKTVILDRDGVINKDAPDHVRTPEQWMPIGGSLEAIAALHQAGWQVVVATNQSGIARGLFDGEALAAIHRRMCREIERHGGRIDAIAFCPHGPWDDCDCRKPAPGLVHALEGQLGRSLKGSPFVGDSRRDLDTAIAAGCRPILVRTGNGRCTEQASGQVPDAVHDDLRAFVAALLGAEEQR